MFEWHTLDESSPHKIAVVRLICMFLGVYYLSSLATCLVLWLTVSFDSVIQSLYFKYNGIYAVYEPSGRLLNNLATAQLSQIPCTWYNLYNLSYIMYNGTNAAIAVVV